MVDPERDLKAMGRTPAFAEGPTAVSFDGTDPTPRRPGRSRRLAAVLLALPALIQPVARLLARSDWRFDLLTHFQVPALVASAVGVLALWRLGRFRGAALAFAGFALFQGADLLRYHGPNPVAPSGDRPGLRVLSANVLANNRDHAALLELIERERPDVVALVEFDTAWMAAVRPLHAAYRHRIERPDGTRGLALYSRFPLRDDPTPILFHPLDLPDPALAATLDLPSGPLNLWVLHPSNPLSGWGRDRGRDEAMALAVAIARRPGPTLVVGDMNRTDGSPILDDFLRESGLRDTRYGFGRQPSWPAWSPYRIAIDHGFVGPEWAVVDRRLGPSIGSDHLPLLLDLAPSARSATTRATQASSPMESGPVAD